ncbi:FtsX-like permease family protein [Streptomyces hoynatensis]|uniref:FtsX-like permease family protein n=1 Tax=Streptomyces hoynatensis TaxID=1141874 RepID=A0A3A9Z5N6_9ACTN|nr:FtsX-like permease family protein [Streptomyces hoynatensis]RKN43144.1 FtsX-like permease family protein [Streptomyces hoynatensis]
MSRRGPRWRAGWRLALRLAWRDARRAKGRSALVVAMIALPILGVTAADLAFRSGQLSEAQQLTRELGRADARYHVHTQGSPMEQSRTGDEYTYLAGGEDDFTSDSRTPAEIERQVRAVLPEGAVLVPDWMTRHVVSTRTGQLKTEVRELDGTDPVTEGMLTLLRGHYPERAGEVAATQAFLDESGLFVGSKLRFRGLDEEFVVTGAYELPDDLGETQVLAPPGTVLPRIGTESDWYLPPASYLVTLPAGEGTAGGVGWDLVQEANAHGMIVDSRAVLLESGGSAGRETQTTVVAGGVSAGALVVLEICLLAGPAFAVGARRSRRQLGLIGANGGDRRQLRAVTLAGGVVLGAVAAAVGLAVGIALTFAGRPLIEHAAGSRFGPWDFRLPELAAIAALSVLTGLLAAMLPAFAAARADVLTSLTGRRGVRRSGRALPLLGGCGLLLGTALALFGGLAVDDSRVTAAGAITAELGLVALTPLLVGGAGRLARLLPLPGRLALRDAARNRGRTAPAVAAVLAAVAGSVTIATYAVGDEAKQRAEYQAALPDGWVSVSAMERDQRELLPQAVRVAERELPVAERAELGGVLPGGADCDPYADDCGSAGLSIPEENRCALTYGDAMALSAAERREWSEDPRCTDDPSQGQGLTSSDMAGSPALGVGGPEILDLLGIGDREARAALEAGEVLVFNPALLDEGPDGEPAITLLETLPGHEYGDGTPEEEADRTLGFPAHLVEGESWGLPALISPEAAERAGLATGVHSVYWTTSRPPTDGERQAFDAALDRLGSPPYGYVESGYQGSDDAGLLILTLAAMVITLGAAGIATGLAQADAEEDLATLAAVGAAPRLRRALSGLQCGLIALLGVLLGTVSGVVSGVALRLAAHRADLADWQKTIDQGWESSARPRLFVGLPWETFAQLVVVVPLLACLVAALLTRSRVPLARRAG